MIDEIVPEPGRNGLAVATLAEERSKSRQSTAGSESTAVNSGAERNYEDLEVCCVPAESRFPD